MGHASDGVHGAGEGAVMPLEELLHHPVDDPKLALQGRPTNYHTNPRERENDAGSLPEGTRTVRCTESARTTLAVAAIQFGGVSHRCYPATVHASRGQGLREPHGIIISRLHCTVLDTDPTSLHVKIWHVIFLLQGPLQIPHRHVDVHIGRIDGIALCGTEYDKDVTSKEQKTGSSGSYPIAGVQPAM